MTRLNSQLGVDFPYMIAPMVGITNLPFRELVRSYLPDGFPALLFTEMLSSRRLAHTKLNTVTETRFKSNERHLVTQLLANEERFITPSVRKLEEAEVFGVDINMGCPVSQTLNHNWGVRLMGDESYAADVVGITRRGTRLPLSVKMRASPGDELDPEYLDRFTRAIQDAGADWITIHGRTRAQKHSGAANWELVGEIAARRTIPVVVNGDVQTADDALRSVRDFGVDGCMIGRAAAVRPWILAQIAERAGRLPPGAARPPQTPEEEGHAYWQACQTLLASYKAHFTEEATILKQFRFFVGQSVKWFAFGHHFWAEMTNGRTVAQVEERLRDYPHVDQMRMADRLTF